MLGYCGRMVFLFLLVTFFYVQICCLAFFICGLLRVMHFEIFRNLLVTVKVDANEMWGCHMTKNCHADVFLAEVLS